MDVETFLLIAGAATGLVGGIVATIVGALHIYGWLPNRYVAKLHEAQKGIAVEIGQELRAVFSEQEAKMAAAMKEAQDAQEGVLRSVDMSAVRSVGLDRQLQRKADKLVGSAILQIGQGVLGGLRLIAPGIADQIEELIEENPEGAMQLWEIVQSRPSFQKYVAPRLRQYLGAQMVNDNPEPSQQGGYGP